MNDQAFGRKAINPALQEAQKAFKSIEAKHELSEQQISQKAFSDNRERLKAERLAREVEAAR